MSWFMQLGLKKEVMILSVSFLAKQDQTGRILLNRLLKTAAVVAYVSVAMRAKNLPPYVCCFVYCERMRASH